MAQPHRVAPLLAALLAAGALPGGGRAEPAARAPEPNPPVFERGPDAPAPPLRVPRAPTLEWVLHRSADGLHPNEDEQELLWLMNRARQDPGAEGAWLATSTEPDVAFGRSFFGVDVGALEAAVAGLPAAPPAAFDRRLYEASRSHSEYLISINGQNHNDQFERVLDSGFQPNGGRLSVFSYADSPLNAHAALNVDWGPGPDGMQDPPGHRFAIMGDYDNVGLALVPDPLPGVGPLVFSGAYMYAANATDHFSRFLVGTVWRDDNANGRYDGGEGFPGVTVMPDLGAYYAVTSAGGGYAIPITASGTYQVTFSGGGIASEQLQVSFGSESELLDLVVPEPAGLLQLLAGAAVLRAARSRRRSFSGCRRS